MNDVTRTEIVFGRAQANHHYAPAKLTAAQRDEVGFRRMDGEGSSSLAAEYGVSTWLIRQCVRKERPL